MPLEGVENWASAPAIARGSSPGRAGPRPARRDRPLHARCLRRASAREPTAKVGNAASSLPWLRDGAGRVESADRDAQARCTPEGRQSSATCGGRAARSHSVGTAQWEPAPGSQSHIGGATRLHSGVHTSYRTATSRISAARDPKRASEIDHDHLGALGPEPNARSRADLAETRVAGREARAHALDDLVALARKARAKVVVS